MLLPQSATSKTVMRRAERARDSSFACFPQLPNCPRLFRSAPASFSRSRGPPQSRSVRSWRAEIRSIPLERQEELSETRLKFKHAYPSGCLRKVPMLGGVAVPVLRSLPVLSKPQHGAGGDASESGAVSWDRCEARPDRPRQRRRFFDDGLRGCSIPNASYRNGLGTVSRGLPHFVRCRAMVKNSSSWARVMPT